MYQIKIGALGLLLMGLFFAGCTPGPPQNRAKGCLDCHSEYAARYTQGGVHQPLKEQGCQACHRTHGLIGGVYLQVPAPELCFRCHQSLSDSLKQSSHIHDPVSKGACQDCHDPHNAPQKGLLHQEKTELCLSCHHRSGFEGKYVHAPVQEGCTTCHRAHGSGERFLLEKKTDELCSDCHDLDAREFNLKHGGNTPSSSCADCHDVHASDRPGLLRLDTHDPVAKKECSACHQSSPEGLGQAQGGAELCLQCHSGQMTDWTGEGIHAPVLDRDCLSCHTVHASDSRGMLKKTPEAICFDCHENIKTGRGDQQHPAGGSVHAPAQEGQCLECHRPHKPGAGQKALLAEDPETLCQSCHADQMKRADRHPAVQQGCLSCHESHNSSLPGLLKEDPVSLCGSCHDRVNDDLGHQTVHQPFRSGQCSSCHEPHGGGGADLLQARAPGLCAECHPQVEAKRQQPGLHYPFAEGECETCHQPHSSDEQALLSETPDDLCASCHSEMTARTALPEEHRNCTACHQSHGNQGDHFLKKGLPELCLGCHDDVTTYWKEGMGHQPAEDGDCTACHDPHFSDLSRVPGKSWTSELCGQCHRVSESDLQSTHRGILPDRKSCRECHDPHGGPTSSLSHPVQHQPFEEGNCRACHSGATP